MVIGNISNEKETLEFNVEKWSTELGKYVYGGQMVCVGFVGVFKQWETNNIRQ